jgi:two-component system, OmpR family, phosphate regulon sensor histidine kinase PhoR
MVLMAFSFRKTPQPLTEPIKKPPIPEATIPVTPSPIETSVQPVVVDANAASLEHERLNSLINSMADAVIAVDEDIKIALYNAAALNILDVNNIVTGSKLSDVLKPIDKNNQPADLDLMVRNATKPFTSRDLRLRDSDDSFVNLYISIAPVHLGYGKDGQHGYVLLMRDITREKSLEEERDEFISVISHELRTPVTIAEGNISNAQLVMERSGDPATIKQALNEAHKQVLFLADMVNDLATLSRAERNSLKVEVESIDPKALVTELATSYIPDAQKKGLEIKTEIDPQITELKSTRLYVREILQNFVTNAIKYTATGSVTIRARPDPKGIRFSVQDTGIGISKGDQERVFDKFFRSEDFRTREANGTGLGLYVTMKLTHLIHAEISVDSELNKGSTFEVFIPNLQ